MTTILNLNNINGKTILLVGDSFSNVIEPFMAIACKQLDTIDLRYYNETSLVEHIENNQYDMVLF